MGGLRTAHKKLLLEGTTCLQAGDESVPKGTLRRSNKPACRQAGKASIFGLPFGRANSDKLICRSSLTYIKYASLLASRILPEFTPPRLTGLRSSDASLNPVLLEGMQSTQLCPNQF